MKTLWPYYSTKTKAFYRDGKKRLVITRANKKVFIFDGDPITGKTIMWNTGETINLSNVTFFNRVTGVGKFDYIKKSLLFQNITLL